jgi:hypothetical protein
MERTLSGAELIDLDATAAAAEIARGALSAEDYCRALIDRIETMNCRHLQ